MTLLKLRENFESVTLDLLLTNILPRVVIQMLKDQFSDYEDINVLTPVRTQTMRIIEKICHITSPGSKINQDMQLLIQNLPQLLIACEGEW